MSEDCYFVNVKKEEVVCIESICIECRDKLYPQTGWFWEGSKNGYGPWMVACLECGKTLNQEPNSDEI